MDPFNPSVTPRPQTRLCRDNEQSVSTMPLECQKIESHPSAPASKGSGSSAGLRRSAGLFNLKLDVENVQKPDDHDKSNDNSNDPSDIYMPMQTATRDFMMTPDQSQSGHLFVPHSYRRRPNTLSLKRPHPFSSTKQTKPSGFLSRSSASLTDTASPAGQKRLHLITSDISDNSRGDLTPELSFRGAKPVQTAFMSTGLQSKKHVPNSPKPRVPETPCKRPINEAILDKDQSAAHLHHLKSSSILDGTRGSPFLGVTSFNSSDRSNQLRRSGLSDRLATVPSGCSSPISSNSFFPPTLDGSASSSSTHPTIDAISANITDSPLVNHPVDRLQRFSIGHISTSTEDIDPPETPTRFGSSGTSGGTGMVHTSTPLFRSSVSAGRQPSEAALTSTPGTAVKSRPLPSVLQSADPADSMSVSLPDSLDQLSANSSIATHSSIGNSSSSASEMSMHTGSSPRTPDIEEMRGFRSNGGGQGIDSIIASSSVESQSSPRPRRNLRLLNLWNNTDDTPHTSPQTLCKQEFGEKDKNESAPPLPPVPVAPPLRVETPLGRTHIDDFPQTPSHNVPPIFLSGWDHDASSSKPQNLGKLNHQNHQYLYHHNNDSNNHQKHHEYHHQHQHQHRQNQHHQNQIHHMNCNYHETHNHNHCVTTCQNQTRQVPHDEFLATRFDKVQSAAFGEFSAVFVVAQGKQRYAVKRTKRPMLGQRERLRRREEVDILRELYSPDETHIVQLVDEWEGNSFGYIMTEFCENGDLSRFLADQGRVSRLEEWRVWKILVEILQGLSVIHSHSILHLDLKPANVFVTFEGHLKIGDFGMATRCPVPPGFEREGDREYIAPEVLERQQYGKPADIFSVGLMMVEIAANIVLPDNGVHWHRLRSGDLSDAGRLSSGDLTSVSSHNASKGETQAPAWAPKFLVDDECLLDRVVSEMLRPQPEKRPTVAQLLLMPEMLLVDQRGQAGAVIYEGEYGPEPEMDDENSVWQRP